MEVKKNKNLSKNLLLSSKNIYVLSPRHADTPQKTCPNSKPLFANATANKITTSNSVTKYCSVGTSTHLHISPHKSILANCQCTQGV